MSHQQFDFKGLNDQEVLDARIAYGINEINPNTTNPFFDSIKSLSKEPMVLLLLITSIIYFASGDYGDSIFLACAILLVAAISLYQDSRSRNALEKLKKIGQPSCKVIRNGLEVNIESKNLVVGDYLIVEEGGIISADGYIIQSNDFSVNESLLTGESFSIFKDKESENKIVYGGTYVSTGLAIIKITAVGIQTQLGQIGNSLVNIQNEKTPLERQISQFVKKMVGIGVIIFLLVWGFNYIQHHNLIDSLLKALTLAMSILPEEIPVAFTTFMAIGAWRLMKMGIVVKQMKTVETLGSATVICTDKTGTLTENKMSLAKLYLLSTQSIINPEDKLGDEEKELIAQAMWSSEPIPFDPMEIALHDAYHLTSLKDERSSFKMIHEYPLSGKPPMMTHIFENNNGKRIIAAKGAPEALIQICKLTAIEKNAINKAILSLAKKGYRLLAVGIATHEGNEFPKNQQEFAFKFTGIVAFYDPPKKNIKTVLDSFYNAGIKVKILTGDNSETTIAIAQQIDFRGIENCITGDELMLLSDSELKRKVKTINIFTRMFPDAKLRVINALKANKEIVAMTGDGVNDGPALKAAHIGIAMGNKGTEIAKQAASIILSEDDLSKMVDAISIGRKIYANLKKAIRYIISIHIPIILTVLIPLLLGWIYPNIFTPVHVIFLELIMGPTCSIIYENEPMEANTMIRMPRPYSDAFFSWKELGISIFQGLAITLGTLFTYQYSVYFYNDETITRTMVFVVLIASNLMLTLVNRSFYYSVITTLFYKNNLVIIILCLTIISTLSLIYIPFLAHFFGFSPLNLPLIITSTSIGFASVLWYELIKIFKRQ
jgi:Ca2+-transporting ATPase